VPAYGLLQLERITGASPDHLALDAPVPPALFAGAGDVTDNGGSRLQVVAGIVERERPTVRGLLHRLAGARGYRSPALPNRPPTRSRSRSGRMRRTRSM
jgi:hypothetical protein